MGDHNPIQGGRVRDQKWPVLHDQHAEGTVGRKLTTPQLVSSHTELVFCDSVELTWFWKFKIAVFALLLVFEQGCFSLSINVSTYKKNVKNRIYIFQNLFRANL